LGQITKPIPPEMFSGNLPLMTHKKKDAVRNMVAFAGVIKKPAGLFAVMEC